MSEAVPQVSVCLLTCNHARYIRRSVESVLAQAVDIDMEVLIGDDCSDDGTSEIVAALAAAHRELITHIRHDPRIGGNANYLSVLKRARAPLVAYLDGDDYWLPGKLAKQAGYMTAHPDCSAVYANAFIVNEAGDRIGLFNDVGDARFDLAAMLRRGNFLNNSSVMFRASGMPALFSSHGQLIDYRMHLIHARSGFLAHIAEPLVAYRLNPGSMTSKSNDTVRELYWEAIMDVPRNLVSANDVAHGVADFYRRVVSRSIRERRWRLAREWAPRVFKASPYGIVRTTLLVAISAVRAACQGMLGKLRTGPEGQRENIRHRR